MTARRTNTTPETLSARGLAAVRTFDRFGHLRSAATEAFCRKVAARVTSAGKPLARALNPAPTKPRTIARKAASATRQVATKAPAKPIWERYAHLSPALLPTPSTPHPTPAQLEARRAQREARAADRAMNRALAQLRGEAAPRAQSYGLSRAEAREVEEMVERARAAGVIA